MLERSANILSNVAKFGETMAKILIDVQVKAKDPDYAVNTHLSEVYTCIVALLQYVQEEHNGLVVGGSFGDSTQCIYRAMKKNTSAFAGENLEVIRPAIILSGAESQPQQNNYRPGGHGQSNFQRGSFRFSNRGWSRGFPNQYNDPVNPGFNARNVNTDPSVAGE